MQSCYITYVTTNLIEKIFPLKVFSQHLCKIDMADNPNPNAATGELPPEVIAFAGKMYSAARTGDVEVFEQALSAGLPANMRNEKGDTLVGIYFTFFTS